ncbi:type II toxin-antitoxin system Phd/YefM family antitoxin [Nocardia terpenica]|uniref:Antitoxin n=1 Tax=Nocardia terpenica TaxID=455432 RepID=A0A164H4X3_9NOCA|nr:type II toxin-antitoxin system prevent-host-death family antitoxin [Nocardia terpenica]KZM68204.1 prevent-host-death protein [Nocardia terpenica]NQE88919.1 type II toxin-antitoxin system prevent-host-death family antitoxin [Nocardia terpenica]
MSTMTAAEASRNFSAVLDRAEHGETITIVRHGHTVAVIAPAPKRTGRDLRLALENSEIPPFDNDYESDIADGLSFVSDEMSDPWAEA